MADKKTFVLWSEEIKARCVTEIRCKDPDGLYEVTISKVSSAKTLKQLGALFGLWIKEESSRMGESEQYVHAKWKAWFLARIYFICQETVEQEMWVEYFCNLKKNKNTETFGRHSKRISLSWATLSQTSDYMKAIEEHYQYKGAPLSIPDKFYKMWEGR